MNSICSIMENYINFSKQRSDLEKSYNINDSMKKIKRKQLITINEVLNNLYEKFVEKLQILDDNGIDNAIRIIDANITKLEKEISDYKVAINSYSKKNISVNIDKKESLTYLTNISHRYLSIEESNNKLKIYKMFLSEIKEYRNQKVYHKAV